MKKITVNIFIIITFCSFPVLGQLPVVKVTPPEISFNVNETGEINIRAENLSGFRAYSIKLGYDSQKLRCLAITRGDFFYNWNTFFFTKADSNANTIQVDEAILGTGFQNGGGSLFKVKFLGLAEGNLNIDFISADLRDTLNNTIAVQTENGSIQITGPLSVSERTEENQELLTAYPNPFNSSTKIEFYSNKNEETEFAIYSITGERVFISGEYSLQKNNYSFLWNGKDLRGNNLPSGIYILTAGYKDKRQILKLIMLR